MKKFFLIVVLLIITGCWNYHELNDLAIVTGIAIDKDYNLTILINNNQKQEDKINLKSVIYEAKGNNIYEAFKNLSLSVPNQIHLSHIEVLILSEDIAKKDIKNIIDFLFRYPQTKNNFQLVIAKNCLAKDILKLTTPSENIATYISKNLKKSNNMQGISYQVNFNEFIKDLVTKNKSPLLPSISLMGNKKNINNIHNIEQTNIENYVKIETMGIFKNDNFLKFSTINESKGINILKNKIKILGVNSNINNKNILTEINYLKTKSKIKNNKLIINLEAKGNILEVDPDVNFKKNIEKIKKSIENNLKNYILDAINLNNNNNINIFDFNTNYKDIIININIKILSSGSLNKNIEVKH